MEQKFKSYKRRWYILLIWCCLTFSQGFLWNNFDSIYPSLSKIFNWSENIIALCSFYGCLCMAIGSLPSAFLLERIGLRRILQVLSCSIAISCAIRCIPGNNLTVTIIANISAIFVGFCAMGIFFIPAHISAAWFPVNERKSATAIGTLFNMIGIAASFVIGPLVVSDPESGKSVDIIRKEYYYYTYAQTGYAIITFLLILIYYPNKPPSPPSESAKTERIQLIQGCKQAMKSVNFWILSVPMILMVGSYGGWISVLSVNLTAKNVDQTTSGWMGFTSTLAGAILGIFAGKLADYCGNLKAIQLAFCFLVLEGSVWMLLIFHEFIPFTLNQAYFAVILVGIGNKCFIPINFELAVETLYPIDEPVIVGLLGSLSNVVSCAFLIVLFFLPSNLIEVLNWFYAIATIITIPFAIIVKAKYKRTDVDLNEKSEVIVERF